MSNQRAFEPTIITLSLLVIMTFLAALPAAAADPVIRNGIDLWVTGDEGRTFFDFSRDPIPAGFFCSDSAAFVGRITFKGEPIATSPPGALGRADTIVQRLDDATFDPRGVAHTRVRVRALSFSSVQPIKTECGAFRVSVALDDGQQPVTRMKIVRDHDQGGRYFAPIALRVRVTFTPLVGKSREQLVLSRSATFPTLSNAVWSSRPGDSSFSHEGVALADTDGDGEPDTFLPGTSNFAPGWRTVTTTGKGETSGWVEQLPEPTEHCDHEGCHCMFCL